MSRKEQQPNLLNTGQNSSEAEDIHERSRLDRIGDRINERLQPLGIPDTVIIFTTATTGTCIAADNKPLALFSAALLGYEGILAYRTCKEES